MAETLSSTRDIDLGDGIDPNASPLESVGTSTTPDTEVSPPDSPYQQQNAILKNRRLLARKKLAQLSQEEKV